MEVLTGETIQSIPINVLIVNATKFDHDEIFSEIERLMEFIRVNSGIHSIFREVLELHYSSLNEIYIPAYVLSTQEQLIAWVEEYEQINTEWNAFIIPIIIVEESLWSNSRLKQELDKASYAIYIRKKKVGCCCFTNKYTKAPENIKFMQQIVARLEDYKNQTARIRIASLRETGNDPDYVKMRNRVKEFEEGRKALSNSNGSTSSISEIEFKQFLESSLKKSNEDNEKKPFLPKEEGSRTLSSIKYDRGLSRDETLFTSDPTEADLLFIEKAVKKSKKSFTTVHLVIGPVDADLSKDAK